MQNEEEKKKSTASFFEMLSIINPLSKNVIKFHNPTDYLLVIVGILAGIDGLSKFILEIMEIKSTSCSKIKISFFITYIFMMFLNIGGVIIKKQNEYTTEKKDEKLIPDFILFSIFKPIFIFFTILKKTITIPIMDFIIKVFNILNRITKCIKNTINFIRNNICNDFYKDKIYKNESGEDKLKSEIIRFLDISESKEVYYDPFEYPNDWPNKDKYYNKVLRFGTYLENKKVSFDIRKRKEDSKYLIKYTTLEDLQNPDKYGEAKEYDETIELENPRNKEKKIAIKEFNKVFKD